MAVAAAERKKERKKEGEKEMKEKEEKTGYLMAAAACQTRKAKKLAIQIAS